MNMIFMHTFIHFVSPPSRCTWTFLQHSNGNAIWTKSLSVSAQDVVLQLAVQQVKGLFIKMTTFLILCVNMVNNPCALCLFYHRFPERLSRMHHSLSFILITWYNCLFLKGLSAAECLTYKRICNPHPKNKCQLNVCVNAIWCPFY